MDDAFRQARSRVVESSAPAFMVDTEGIIVAWNTAATGFFGIPAWAASAHLCADIVRGSGCSEGCPFLRSVAPSEVEVAEFDIPGVPPASVLHEPVCNAAGQLLGVQVKVMMPSSQPVRSKP
jgi:hypothetical protein